MKKKNEKKNNFFFIELLTKIKNCESIICTVVDTSIFNLMLLFFLIYRVSIV